MADVMYTEHSRHKQLRHTTILLYFCQTGKTKTNHYIDCDNKTCKQARPTQSAPFVNYAFLFEFGLIPDVLKVFATTLTLLSG